MSGSASASCLLLTLLLLSPFATGSFSLSHPTRREHFDEWRRELAGSKVENAAALPEKSGVVNPTPLARTEAVFKKVAVFKKAGPGGKAQGVSLCPRPRLLANAAPAFIDISNLDGLVADSPFDKVFRYFSTRSECIETAAKYATWTGKPLAFFVFSKRGLNQNRTVNCAVGLVCGNLIPRNRQNQRRALGVTAVRARFGYSRPTVNVLEPPQIGSQPLRGLYEASLQDTINFYLSNPVFSTVPGEDDCSNAARQLSSNFFIFSFSGGFTKQGQPLGNCAYGVTNDPSFMAGGDNVTIGVP